jgi:TRAP-type C4-dicarboxylate transport system permease small subunit
MERTRIPLIYGYAVCLVTVITMLFVIPNLIDNIFRLTNSLQGDRGAQPALSSFEAYTATYDRGRAAPTEARAPSPLTEDELRRQYEALRQDRIASNRFAAMRGLVSGTLLLAFALGLFIGHWRWLRRQGRELAGA